MTINPLPYAQKVLVLAPHPDDESIGCGGTIALYSSKGVDVHLAVISSGENIAREFVGDIDVAEARCREMEAASRILGIKEVYSLGFPDGQLALHKEGIEEKLREIISDINPDIIFAPSPFDSHDDHRAVSEVAINFLIGGCLFKVAFYEVYGTVRFDTLIDISSVISIKENAIKNYHYSLMRQPELYNESIKGLNRFRSFYARKLGYYEAFWLVSGKMTQSEIYSWLTYGMDEPAIKFLSKLNTVDKLLVEIDKKNQILQLREAEISEVIKAKTKAFAEVSELKSKIEAMEKSLLWRFGSKYYAMRDRILPEGSFQRNIYNHLLKCLKKGQT